MAQAADHEGRNRVLIPVTIARILVGSLFIVSGLIKANDAIGFSYKMDEYFSQGVLDLPFLIPWSLEFSIVLSVVEVLVGFSLLAGILSRLTNWVLLLMILFFTFLTFYSAYFGVVKDCGCFGDALELTPWQSFGKDVALLLLTLITFFKKDTISFSQSKGDLTLFGSATVLIALFSIGILGWGFPVTFALVLFLITLLLKRVLDSFRRTEWVTLGIAVVITSGFTLYTTHYLPIKDFRPYAKGKSIPEQMKVPEGKGPVYEHVFVYKNKESGKERKLKQDALPSVNPDLNQDNWKFVERKDELVKAGYTPPVHDFYIERPSVYFRDELLSHLYVDRENGQLKLFASEPEEEKWNSVTRDRLQTLTEQADDIDHTNYFLHMEKPLLMVISHDIKRSGEGGFEKLGELSGKLSDGDMEMIGITSSDRESIEDLKHQHQLRFPFFNMDQTTLKTIVRSNPGLVLLQEGKVVEKWPSTDLPVYDEITRAIPQ